MTSISHEGLNSLTGHINRAASSPASSDLCTNGNRTGYMFNICSPISMPNHHLKQEMADVGVSTSLQ